MSKLRFPWRKLIFLIITIFGGIILYDVYINKGFKESRTAKILQDAGLLTFLEQVWHRICIYSSFTLAWLKENVPFYYAKACAFVGPYLQLFAEKLHEFWGYTLEITKPHRDWLAEKIPQLLAVVQAKLPVLTETVKYYSLLAWDFIYHGSLWLWTHIAFAAKGSGAWLEKNVLTGKLSYENIQETATHCLMTLQNYTSTFVQWCSTMINAKTN